MAKQSLTEVLAYTIRSFALLHLRPPTFFQLRSSAKSSLHVFRVVENPNKGVLGFQSPTRGWVGRSAEGREKKKMEPSAE